MSEGDRDWQNWNPHVPAGARPRRKGELAWTLRRGADRVDAGFIGRGEYGWEVQIYKNKQLLIGQLFQLRAMAEQFSAEQRVEFESKGWTAPFTTQQ